MLDFGFVPDGEIEVEKERDREGETETEMRERERRQMILGYIFYWIDILF